MSEQASQSEMNEFVRVVDEFMQKYARLASPETRRDVYASGDAKLIADYESAVTKGGWLKSNIESVTGAWKAAKEKYREITQTTSMVIGDAIDEIRSWFGYNPGGMNGLGAVQIPAAVWVAGTVAAALVLINLMNKIFIAVEASRIQRQNPGMSREIALDKARDAVGFDFFGLKSPWVLLGLGLLVYAVIR